MLVLGESLPVGKDVNLTLHPEAMNSGSGSWLDVGLHFYCLRSCESTPVTTQHVSKSGCGSVFKRMSFSAKLFQEESTVYASYIMITPKSLERWP